MKIFKEITGHGPDVVLIHGWGCDHRYMQPIAKLLEKHYRVTNVDVAGVGTSEWDESIDSIQDFAAALLPALPEKAIYIGWSFGGLVCQAIAAAHPEKVQHLILVGSAPRFIEAPDWPGIPMPGFKAAFTAQNDKDFIAFMTEYYQNEFANLDPATSNYNQLMKVLIEKIPFTYEVLHKGIDIVDRADLREEYKMISCPIDIILGDMDPSVIVDFDKVKQLNPATQVHYIKGAQHLMHWTHPKEFAKILNGILALS